MMSVDTKFKKHPFFGVRTEEDVFRPRNAHGINFSHLSFDTDTCEENDLTEDDIDTMLLQELGYRN